VAGLTELTIAEIREGLARRDFSARELTDAYLAAIEAGNAAFNAYIVVTPERARAMAEESDRRLAAGEPRHPLRGVRLVQRLAEASPVAHHIRVVEPAMDKRCVAFAHRTQRGDPAIDAVWRVNVHVAFIALVLHRDSTVVT
jgi:hypothetical protein